VPEISMSRTVSPGVAPQAWLPFEELVDAHWNWQQTRDDAAEAAYRAKLAAFEDECGQIVDSYWSTSVPSAVALTERPRRWRPSELRFHRVSDWATKNEPEIATLLHKCDELTIKIARILRAPTRDIVMRLVVSSATHLLSLVDGRAEHRRHDDKENALEHERVQLEEAERYYDEVGQRQAQLVYLRGMIGGVLVIALITAGTWAVSGFWGISQFDVTYQRVVLAIVLGAAGALLSVMSRMTDSKQGFELDYELGWRPLVVFGVFRPLLGAAFGLVLYGAIASGVVSLQLMGQPRKETAFYALLSFAAGWSERLAKDVLDAADKTVGSAIKARQEPAEASPGRAKSSPSGVAARHGP
jgi:hypothetical protein